MIKAEFDRLNVEHRRRPLAERVPEVVYLTDVEGNIVIPRALTS